MIRILTIAVLASLASGFAALGGVKDGAPWQVLFDGKDTSDWRGFRQKDFPSAVWTVEDGTLKRRKRSGAARGDLATRRAFSNFELEFEWKISPGGNSGVKYLVREDRPQSWDRASYEYSRRDLIRRGRQDSEEFRELRMDRIRLSPIGFEFQILDDSANPDARNGRHRVTGSLYDLLPVTVTVDAGAERFHQGRIVANDGLIQHWVDGVKTLEFRHDGPELGEAVRKSKFAKMAGFGLNRRGHITLQDHGDEVWFRNIRIREIANRQIDEHFDRLP